MRLRNAILPVLSGLALLVSVPEGRAQFGTLKGQIVFGEAKFPAPKEITVNNNPEHCLSKGKLFHEAWVIDKDSKGVRWVVVWLLDREGKTLPPNPALKTPTENVVMDQPCCMFVPRVVALRQGQVLEVRNSAPIDHNVNWSGGGAGQPSGNVKLGPDRVQKIEGIKPTSIGAMIIQCNIHMWMKGWVRVFDHPYYAVTDKDGKFEIKGVPAGEWNLVVWHEEAGWAGGGSKGAKRPVTVTADKDNDLGKIPIVPLPD